MQKPLTARPRPQNLRDHFLAFLAVHNPNGFNPETVKDPDDTTVFGVLFLLTQQRQVTRKEISRAGKKLVRMAPVYSHGQYTEMIAMVLGYNTYAALRHCRKGDVNSEEWWVKNRMYRMDPTLRITSDATTTKEWRHQNIKVAREGSYGS